MGSRVVFRFAGLIDESNPDWVRIREYVALLGGSHLRSAHAELPGVATFILPEQVSTDDILSELKADPSVDEAEVDALSVPT